MDRSTLRPGNWVYKRIDGQGDSLHCLKDKEDIQNSSLASIHLNDVIFINFRFTKIMDSGEKTWWKYPPQPITYYPKNESMLIDETWYNEIKYLHQIQNSFYEQMGKELDFQL